MIVNGDEFQQLADNVTEKVPGDDRNFMSESCTTDPHDRSLFFGNVDISWYKEL